MSIRGGLIELLSECTNTGRIGKFYCRFINTYMNMKQAHFFWTYNFPEKWVFFYMAVCIMTVGEFIKELTKYKSSAQISMLDNQHFEHHMTGIFTKNDHTYIVTRKVLK